MDMERFDSMDVARDSLHGFWNKLPDYDAQCARDHVALCFVREAGSLLWAEAHPFVAVDAQVWGEIYPHDAAFLRSLVYMYLKHRSDTLACQNVPMRWTLFALEGSGLFTDECETKPELSSLGATSKAPPPVELIETTPCVLSKAAASVDALEGSVLFTDECGIKHVDGLSSTFQTKRDSLSSLCSVTFTWILRFVGAHDLELVWSCAACKPYWYNWYCKECHGTNQYLRWTPEGHFGVCGQSCGCCRAAAGERLGCCEACDDLRCLKETCSNSRKQLCDYDGR